MAKKPKTKSKKPKSQKPLGIGSRGRRKLADGQVLAIVARLRAGELQKDLAVEFGVSGVAVSAIWRGRSYVWLTGIKYKSAGVVAEDLKLAA